MHNVCYFALPGCYNNPKAMYVFVYGTLKKGYYNHYLLEDDSGAKFIGPGITIDKYPLVVASAYHIPFLLNAKDKGG